MPPHCVPTAERMPACPEKQGFVPHRLHVENAWQGSGSGRGRAAKHTAHLSKLVCWADTTCIESLENKERTDARCHTAVICVALAWRGGVW